MKLVLVVGALALAFTAAAGSASTGTPAAPSGLHAFVYRADEPVKADHTYARCPPSPGSRSRRLELRAPARDEQDVQRCDDALRQVLRRAGRLRTAPGALDDRQALRPLGRVRVVAAGKHVTVERAVRLQHSLAAGAQRQPRPRGDPLVHGQRGHCLQIWYQNVPGNFQDHFRTLTNVADEREYWSSMRVARRPCSGACEPSGSSTGALPNGIQVVHYGPYSPVFTTRNSGRSTAAGSARSAPPPTSTRRRRRRRPTS